MNGIFFPMFFQGLAGVSRRLYDGGETYLHAQGAIQYNDFMAFSSQMLFLFQLFFIYNFKYLSFETF